MFLNLTVPCECSSRCVYDTVITVTGLTSFDCLAALVGQCFDQIFTDPLTRVRCVLIVALDGVFCAETFVWIDFGVAGPSVFDSSGHA